MSSDGDPGEDVKNVKVCFLCHNFMAIIGTVRGPTHGRMLMTKFCTA